MKNWELHIPRLHSNPCKALLYAIINQSFIDLKYHNIEIDHKIKYQKNREAEKYWAYNGALSFINMNNKNFLCICDLLDIPPQKIYREFIKKMDSVQIKKV